MHLLAETSGKNAIVITQAADLDLAIRDLVRSAFGHAGQKCSAASLAIVEASLYDDAVVHGAAWPTPTRSLVVGPPSDLGSVVGPLIGDPSPKLQRGLTQLDRGERWLVEPRLLGDNLWSPGVRVGVQPGSWFHVTECFGPVLGVMRADDLDHAIELQNGDPVRPHRRHPLARRRRGRALARGRAGRQRLRQPRHHRRHRATPAVRWMEAIVGRLRPEGRWSRLRRRDGHRPALGHRSPMSPNGRIGMRGRSGSAASHDPTGLASERNELRYRPLDGVLVRVGPDTPDGALAAARDAAELCGTTGRGLRRGDRAGVMRWSND